MMNISLMLLAGLYGLILVGLPDLLNFRGASFRGNSDGLRAMIKLMIITEHLYLAALFVVFEIIIHIRAFG